MESMSQPAIKSTSREPRGRALAFGVLVGVVSVLLTVACFPPFDVAEAAYVVVLPFLIWALFRPGRWVYALSALASCWAAWFVILIWLRHIYPPMGWVALGLLSFLVALFPLCWLLVARWALPRLAEKGFPGRLAIMLGLAGLWVVLEWVRTCFLTGFPWLTLSESQWQRAAMLQIAAWTGHWGVSFVLVFFNFGLLFYGRNLAQQIGGRLQKAPLEPEPVQSARQRFEFGDQAAKGGLFGSGIRFAFCPEFYLALAVLLLCFFTYLLSLTQQRQREEMFRAAAVQPWVPATLKWDPAEAKGNIDTLKRLTDIAGVLEPDVILWPEASTPFPILDDRDARMLRWTEELVDEVDAPLLAGSLSMIGDQLFNGVFWITPGGGLHDIFYLKRHPVPFGEYAPLRDALPFIGKVVPLENDIIAGDEATVIPTELGGKRLPVGVLICNEDIYPGLARDMARNGAKWLLVVTNDAWYGVEAGAYQHAAHSVLRAVETRLPVVRCGNHGWSGWIDEFGRVREVLTDADGSIYYQGVGPLNVTRATELPPGQSFYVRHGDWFVALCAVFAAGMAALAFFRGSSPPRT